MKFDLHRVNRKNISRVLAIAALAAIGWDLHHVYEASQLLVKRASDNAASLQLLAQDLSLVSGCKRNNADQPANGYTGCLEGVLPSLKTAVGMYAGIALSTGWLAGHPGDKEVRSVASATMDRLWQHYWEVDMASYRLADDAGEDLNKSVLYRAFVGAAYTQTAADWRTRLKEAEFALNDPDLARKQHERELAYAMSASQTARSAPGQTTIK